MISHAYNNFLKVNIEIIQIRNVIHVQQILFNGNHQSNVILAHKIIFDR
jgi:hypothetical protein